MTLTLLADLDDTLLGNDFGNFLPYYLDALGNHLKPFVEPEILIHNLMSATQKMIANNHPDRTLKQVFDAHFFPAINVEPAKLQDGIETFYEEVFPQLSKHTHPRQDAIQFIHQTLQGGYRVAIATNPLFPRVAIEERLKWAGLSPQDCAFSIIPSYETFHFAKPNPAYFAEILAQIGWPEGGILMIGDELENDIIASRQLGLPAFWISAHLEIQKSNPYAPTASGSISDCSQWLHTAPTDILQPNYKGSESLKAILSATPAALDTLLTNLSKSAWVLRPEKNEWSLTEIICHLRDVEIEVNLPRLQKVLDENDPFIPGKDTDSWVNERQYIDQDGLVALADFTYARIQVLNMLENISQDSWNRSARHAIFGPTDLEELINFIASHDQLHLRQIHNLQLKPSLSPEDIKPLAA